MQNTMHDGGLQASHMGLLLVLGWLQFAPDQDMTNPPRLQGSSTMKQHRSESMHHRFGCTTQPEPLFVNLHSSQLFRAKLPTLRVAAGHRAKVALVAVGHPSIGQNNLLWPGLCEPVDLERHVRWATVMSSTF